VLVNKKNPICQSHSRIVTIRRCGSGFPNTDFCFYWIKIVLFPLDVSVNSEDSGCIDVGQNQDEDELSNDSSSHVGDYDWSDEDVEVESDVYDNLPPLFSAALGDVVTIGSSEPHTNRIKSDNKAPSRPLRSA
jgi:hypothetical protein